MLRKFLKAQTTLPGDIVEHIMELRNSIMQTVEELFITLLGLQRDDFVAITTRTGGLTFRKGSGIDVAAVLREKMALIRQTFELNDEE